MSPAFTEVLRAQKSSKSNAMNFTPTEAGGLLTIHTARASVQYVVQVLLTDMDGRAFRLAKLSSGSDAESENYDVFCGRGRQSCECKGFLRWNTPCKHIAAAESLIENGWM